MGRKVGNWYHYSGAVHIHTTESDGTKSLEEIIRIGQEVGLDFMMFADHMTLGCRERGGEGMYGKTLVVIGYEHNDQDDIHHYLFFGSPRVYPDNMTPKEYVAAGAADGAIGIMAHPDEIRNRLDRFPPYPWKDWSVDGYTGLEIWNQMSEWMEQLTRYNLLPMAFSPRKSLVAPTDRILRKWDELNMTRKVAGIAGPDAHAFKFPIGPITVEIFPYKVHFKCLRTHIILSEPMSTDFETARSRLYDAIRDCRLYFSNMRWGNADSFWFYAARSDEQVPSGGQLDSPDGVHMHIRTPSRATLRLIHNGKVALETLSDRLTYRVTEPGIYRAEAWKGRRGWIFSNHIRIGI
ncbi:MAG: histidinol-phosphatase [Candidatus Zixiibacteriota bacterium]